MPLYSSPFTRIYFSVKKENHDNKQKTYFKHILQYWIIKIKEDINYVNQNKISVIHISLVRGHYFALKYFFETYKNIKDFDLTAEIIYPIRNDHLMSLKCYIEYLMNKYDSDKFQEIINGYKMHYKKTSENVIYILDQLIDEIKSEKM